MLIYEGLLTLYVVLNFGLSTFLDPGIYTHGESFQFWIYLIIPLDRFVVNTFYIKNSVKVDQTCEIDWIMSGLVIHYYFKSTFHVQ